MKKTILLLFSLVLSSILKAQSTAPLYYIDLAPAITTNIGTIDSKFAPSIEIGKQWDVMSLGIAMGRTNCSPIGGRDTSVYYEFRPNLNIFQVGKFVNTFTPGIGFIPWSSQYMMLEMTSGIEYTWNTKTHVNFFFGQYYYSGYTSNSSASFFGVSIARFFSPYIPKAIIHN